MQQSFGGSDGTDPLIAGAGPWGEKDWERHGVVGSHALVPLRASGHIPMTRSDPVLTRPEMRDPRFSDEESQEILRRAVSIDTPGLAAAGDGLSLGDLREAAEAAGIDPEEVERAALSVLRERDTSASGVLGASRAIHLERTVEGTAVASDFPKYLAAIRRTVRPGGEAKEIGGSLEWSAKSDLAERHVSISTTGGRTTVLASADLSNLAAATFLAPGLIGVVTAIIAFLEAAEAGDPGGVILGLLLVPILYVVLRTVFGKLVAAEHAKLQRAVDELASLIGADPA